jgi:hypothetical protein
VTIIGRAGDGLSDEIAIQGHTALGLMTDSCRPTAKDRTYPEVTIFSLIVLASF